jgi:hypothetical protein
MEVRENREREYYRRGREILGKSCGGLLTTLLKSKYQDLDAASRVIEQAAQKSDPREWVAAVSRRNGKMPETIPSTLREKRMVTERYYASMDSPQWLAWDEYLKTRGKSAIRDRDGGWWFPSEWPPAL